jgi:hypothetical protein
MSVGRIFGIIGGAFLLLFALFTGGSLVESVDANEIVLIQSVGGSLNWHTTPGFVWQGFGKVTKYGKRGTIAFQTKEKSYSGSDERLPLVFNDGGKGWVQGSINYELPMDSKRLTELHQFYPDQASLEAGLIKPALNKSVYLTGTTMTSYESYKEKRAALIQYVEDQVQNGVFRTKSVTREIPEETIGPDGQPRTVQKPVTAVEIETNAQGQVQRAETGQLSRFGVRAFNFAIEDLGYDTTVTDQIKSQQVLAQAVQTSIAKAKQAIQDAVTAEAEGRANIAQERAKQEITKTQAVVQAEKERDVSKLAAERAGFYKTEQLLKADADSEYRRRIMSADNALGQRLEAYKAVNQMWAQAFANYKGSLVPQIVGGGDASSGKNGGLDFMQIIGMKAAKDLAVESGAK